LAPSTAPLLEVSDLTVEFSRGRGRPPLKAVDSVSLSVSPGETLGLVGESGSGKTTLALAILGLAPIAAGDIRFAGRDLAAMSRRARSALSQDLQVVFQDPYSSLNPARTIGQSLAEPLDVEGRSGKAEKRQRIAAILEKVGLPADAAARYPVAFSGGQRQRIAIARALIVSPKLVICDEAVSALDLSIQAQILNLLADLQRDLGVAYIFVSHDLAVVRHLASRVVVLYRGQVMEAGAVDAVCERPSHPYTQALLAAAPTPDPTQRHSFASDSTSERADARQVTQTGCPYQGRCPIVIERCRTERPEPRVTAGGTSAACHRVSTNGAASEAPVPTTYPAI
jgi:peptide/nickel transport system ATP-binding protein